MKELRGKSGAARKAAEEGLADKYKHLTAEERADIVKKTTEANEAWKHGNPQPLGATKKRRIGSEGRQPVEKRQRQRRRRPRRQLAMVQHEAPSDILMSVQSRGLEKKREEASARERQNVEEEALANAQHLPGGVVAMAKEALAAAQPHPLQEPEGARTWDGSIVAHGVTHLRSRFQGWKDNCKKISELKSKGNHAVGKLHRSLHGVFRAWCETVKHNEVPAIKDKAADPLPPKDFLCLKANMCLCSQRGRRTVTIHARLNTFLKDVHPKGPARDLLENAQIVVLACGTKMQARGVEGRKEWDPSLPPDVAKWFLVAHLLLRPWIPTWLEMFDKVADLSSVVKRRVEDDVEMLDQPGGTLELRHVCGYFTDYELAHSLSPEYRWEVCSWQLVWSERLVDCMEPDTCEVKIMDPKLTTIYDPQRHRKADLDANANAWADEAEDEDEEDDDHRESDKESDAKYTDKDDPPEPETESDHTWRPSSGEEHPSQKTSHRSDSSSSSSTSTAHEEKSIHGESGESEPEDEKESGESETDRTHDDAESSNHSHADEPSHDSEIDDPAFRDAPAKCRVPGLGWVAWHDDENEGFFLARCTAIEHRCELPCQTTRVARAGRKAGQGRPLGWLMCWLKRARLGVPNRPVSRALHVKPLEPFHPHVIERTLARRELMLLPGATDLAAHEAGGSTARPAEPVDFA